MGRSPSSPPGLNHGRTKAGKKKKNPFLLGRGSCTLYEVPVPRSLAQAGRAPGGWNASPCPALTSASPTGNRDRASIKTETEEASVCRGSGLCSWGVCRAPTIFGVGLLPSVAGRSSTWRRRIPSRQAAARRLQPPSCLRGTKPSGLSRYLLGGKEISIIHPRDVVYEKLERMFQLYT